MPSKDPIRRREVQLAWYAKPENRQRHIENTRIWRAANKQRHDDNARRSDVRKKYGLSLEEYRALKFGKVCQACGSSIKLCLDHCHKTRKIRGILCVSCNLALGLLDDSTARIDGLLKYLSLAEIEQAGTCKVPKASASLA
jgi:Autographiviridae endonuclease VII